MCPNRFWQVLILSCMLAAIGGGETYTPTEVVLIEWGDGAGQLKICEPSIEVNPDDTTQVMVWPCGGPRVGFVDKNENFYFAMSDLWNEFKVFRPDALLLIDLSEGAPAYRPEFYQQGVAQFHVDSLCQIYLNGGWSYDYLTVVDTLGNLVDKLSPYGVGSGRRIVTFYRSSGDVLLFKIRGAEGGQTVSWTYRNNSFTPGGSMWLARDGNCYWLWNLDSLTLEFTKDGGQDSLGHPAWKRIEQRPYPIPMTGAMLLGVDDAMKIYVDICLRDGYERVAVYDTLYELQTEIVFPFSPFTASRYEWSLAPFVRRDGNVYEFRCLDDGMHIIRWARE